MRRRAAVRVAGEKRAGPGKRSAPSRACGGEAGEGEKGTPGRAGRRRTGRGGGAAGKRTASGSPCGLGPSRRRPRKRHLLARCGPLRGRSDEARSGASVIGRRWRRAPGRACRALYAKLGCGTPRAPRAGNENWPVVAGRDRRAPTGLGVQAARPCSRRRGPRRPIGCPAASVRRRNSTSARPVAATMADVRRAWCPSDRSHAFASFTNRSAPRPTGRDPLRVVTVNTVDGSASRPGRVRDRGLPDGVGAVGGRGVSRGQGRVRRPSGQGDDRRRERRRGWSARAVADDRAGRRCRCDRDRRPLAPVRRAENLSACSPRVASRCRQRSRRRAGDDGRARIGRPGVGAA